MKVSEQQPTAEVKPSYESRVDNVVDKKRAEIFGEISRVEEETEKSNNRGVGLDGADNLRTLVRDKNDVRARNANRIQELKDEWAELGGDELDVRQQNLANPDEYGPNVAQFELKMAKVHMYENIQREDKEGLFKTAEELSELQEGTSEYDDKLKNLEEEFDGYAETFGLSEDKKAELMEQLAKAGGHEEVSPEEMDAALRGEDQPTEESAKPEAETTTPEVETSEAERKVRDLERQLQAANEQIESQGRTIESLQTTSQTMLKTMREMQEQTRIAMETMQATIEQQSQTIAELQGRPAQGGEAQPAPADLNPTPGAPVEPFGPIPNRFTAENNRAASAQNKGLFKKAWEYLFGSKEKDSSQELEPKDRRMKKLGRHAVLWDSIDNAYARNDREVPAIEIYKGKDFNEWLGEVLNSTSSDINSMSDFESLVARMAGKKSIKVMKDNDTGKVELKIGGKKADDATAIWALWPMVYGSRPPQQAQQRFAEQGR